MDGVLADIGCVAVHHEIIILPDDERNRVREVLRRVRREVAVAVRHQLKSFAIKAVVNSDLKSRLAPNAAALAIEDAEVQGQTCAGRLERYPLRVVCGGGAKPWRHLTCGSRVIDAREPVNVAHHTGIGTKRHHGGRVGCACSTAGRAANRQIMRIENLISGGVYQS